MMVKLTTDFLYLGPATSLKTSMKKKSGKTFLKHSGLIEKDQKKSLKESKTIQYHWKGQKRRNVCTPNFLVLR